MMNPILITFLGALTVLLYDTVGSHLSILFGFDYSWLSLGSFLIYAAIGCAASRHSLIVGVVAATTVGIIDSTLGWYISWIIGPGRTEEISLGTVVFVVIFVATVSAISGLLGAFVARALKLS